jgi:hypothetical protein
MPLAVNHNRRTTWPRPESGLVENMANRKDNPDEYKFGRSNSLKVKKSKGKINNQNHRTISSFGSNNYGNDNNYKQIDLHNNALHQAKDRIKDELRDAYSDSLPGVKFIHGNNNGIAIRDWLSSESFQQFIMTKKMTASMWYNRDGITNVSFGIKN